MTYKNILVHLDDSKSCDRRVEAAIALAQAHGAHLTGLYVAPDPLLPGTLRAEVPAQFLVTLREQVEERMQAAAERCRITFERAGIGADCRTAHATGARVPEVIGLHARYADLVVLGQPEPDGAGAGDAFVVENVILSSGRPGLLIPYIGAGKTLGDTVMIAWDGGREAARAVSDAMPILERAKSVTVVVVDPHRGEHGEDPGADIALHLARHEIKVEAQHMKAAGLSVTDALLSRVADLGADLMVMGCYGHSRMRELVLGGVTRRIFEQMTVPVIMSH